MLAIDSVNNSMILCLASTLPQQVCNRGHGGTVGGEGCYHCGTGSAAQSHPEVGDDHGKHSQLIGLLLFVITRCVHFSNIPFDSYSSSRM